MKKILIVGSLVGLASARAFAELNKVAGVEFVEKIERAEALALVERRRELSPEVEAALGFPSPRKSKGEKKRAAAAMRRKGWK